MRASVRVALSCRLLLIVAFGAASDVPPTSPRTLHERGLTHLRRNEAADARSVLTQLRESHPASTHYALLAGHCCLMLERNEEEAVRHYHHGESAAADEADAADAKHAMGRLHRMAGRWDEAARSFHEAHTLAPASVEFEQDLLFAQAKVHLLVGQPDAASAALERGFELADAAWRPHFARELANAVGMAGDHVAAAQHYEKALALGGVSDRTTVAEALSALAALHERNDVAVAAGFLRGAAASFVAAAEAAAGRGPAIAAHAYLRAAETLEALHALGDWTSDVDGVAPGGGAADGAGGGGATAATLPDARLASAQAQYERALSLQPQLVEAYDGMGRLLLGLSRTANFGAVHAAAMHVDEGERLLRMAANLDGPFYTPSGTASGVAATSQSDSAERWAERRRWRAAQLAFLDETKSELADWAALAQRLRAARNPPTSAADAAVTAGAGAGAGAEADEYRPPSWLEGVQEIDRVVAPTTEAGMRRLVERSEPAVLVGLQTRAGFAPAEEWSVAALRSKLGNATVKVPRAPRAFHPRACLLTLSGAPTARGARRTPRARRPPPSSPASPRPAARPRVRLSRGRQVDDTRVATIRR